MLGWSWQHWMIALGVSLATIYAINASGLRPVLAPNP